MLTDYSTKRLTRANQDEVTEALRLACAMRAAQARYFANRTKENLIASKNAERDFDRAAIALAGQDEGKDTTP